MLRAAEQELAVVNYGRIPNESSTSGMRDPSLIVAFTPRDY
jgi:hypothetical protein